jgi:hypothetical protein
MSTPVMLPPACARLTASPSRMPSTPIQTIGVVPLAALF